MFKAFLLSLIAGSATGIGALFVIYIGSVSDRFIASSMGFASGVMLLVSFLNLFMESLDLTSYINVTLAFAAGSVIMIIIDSLLPHFELGKKEDGVIKSKLLESSVLILIGHYPAQYSGRGDNKRGLLAPTTTRNPNSHCSILA